MEFDFSKAKGVLDRSFPLSKIAFHKDCSAVDALQKCRETVWGEEKSQHYDYFLADGSGSSIGSTAFTVSNSDGSKEILPWTVSNYLRISGLKYPSRMRLYCGQKISSK